MIRLTRYGVVLRQLDVDDLEKVRIWRNGPDVMQYMAHREYITPAMHERWYAGVRERGDLYFMICQDGQDVGVINLKEIDLCAGEAEGGIFMAREELCSTLTPFRASMCILDFGFEVLRLKRKRVHVLDGNGRSIRFCTTLGYRPTQILVNGSCRRYYLERDDYYNHTLPRLQRVLERPLSPTLTATSSPGPSAPRAHAETLK